MGVLACLLLLFAVDDEGVKFGVLALTLFLDGGVNNVAVLDGVVIVVVDVVVVVVVVVVDVSTAASASSSLSIFSRLRRSGENGEHIA